MEQDITFGQFIRQARRQKGWKLRELAQAARLSMTHLSRLENDIVKPSPETIVRLARALGTDLAFMLPLSGNIPKEVVDLLNTRDQEHPLPEQMTIPGLELSDAAGADNLSPQEEQLLRHLLARRFRLAVQEVEDLLWALHQLADMDLMERRAVIAFLGRRYARTDGADTSIPGGAGGT